MRKPTGFTTLYEWRLNRKRAQRRQMIKEGNPQRGGGGVRHARRVARVSAADSASGWLSMNKTAITLLSSLVPCGSRPISDMASNTICDISFYMERFRWKAALEKARSATLLRAKREWQFGGECALPHWETERNTCALEICEINVSKILHQQILT